jgi:hypothetical protein
MCSKNLEHRLKKLDTQKIKVMFDCSSSKYGDSCLKVRTGQHTLLECEYCLTLLASWVPSLDIFSSSLRVGVFEEVGARTDDEVAVDVD